MTDLPPGWEWTTLGEIAPSIKNGIFVARPGAGRDGVPILRINAVRPLGLRLDDLRYSRLSIAELKHRDALLTEGDLLFTRYSGSKDYVGVCAVVPAGVGPLTYPDKLIRSRVDQRIALPKFVAAAFSSSLVRLQVEQRIKTTAGQIGIAGSSLATVELPLPPVAEQHRILALLDEQLVRLDRGVISVRVARRRRGPLERELVGQAIYGSVINRNGSRAAASPSPADVRDGHLPSLPSTWRWMRLHEFAEVVGGVTKDSSRQSDPAVPLIPYLRVANVQRGRLDLSEVTTIRVPKSRAEALRLMPGDVLLNEGGDRDKLGRGWIWEGQVENCIHQNHVFRARIRDGALHPKLLAWHANGFGHWFEVNGKQSVNLASISLRTIKQLPVPVPPAEEQEGIVRYIENRMADLARLDASLREVEQRGEELHRALLADAFAGRLVSQDPDDEPASVVLDRIRAERAVTPRRRTARRS